jgi:hypothetical protein
VGTWDGMRDAERLPKKSRETGEPCALKGASTVRGGADRKGLAEILLEEGISFKQVEVTNSTSLAAYSTNTGTFKCLSQLEALRAMVKQTCGVGSVLSILDNRSITLTRGTIRVCGHGL